MNKKKKHPRKIVENKGPFLKYWLEKNRIWIQRRRCQFRCWSSFPPQGWRAHRFAW